MSMKFYRPDLRFAPVTDYPCAEDDHENCVGISPPFKCACECHEMSDEEIAAMERKGREGIAA